MILLTENDPEDVYVAFAMCSHVKKKSTKYGLINVNNFAQTFYTCTIFRHITTCQSKKICVSYLGEKKTFLRNIYS